MRLLVTVDHSDRDRIALAKAAELAGATNGVAMLVHVLPRTRALVPGAVRDAEAYLHAIQVSLADSANFMVETLVLKGDVATEITRTAHQFEVDLVLMVTRGRRGLDKVMLGSVAGQVLAHCRAPLVLLNEATFHVSGDAEIERQSTYLAGIIWNRRSKGLCSDEDALEELERLARQGLDRALLLGTYNALAKQGAASDLLDIEFQLNTLRRYLPDEVEQQERRAS